jgi:predicted HTH domain antitoxin
MSTVTLEIPAEFAASFGATEEEVRCNARLELAIEMYREGRWSTGKAARFTSMSRVDFMDLLRERQVPLPYTPDMVEEDLEHARSCVG